MEQERVEIETATPSSSTAHAANGDAADASAEDQTLADTAAFFESMESLGAEEPLLNRSELDAFLSSERQEAAAAILLFDAKQQLQQATVMQRDGDQLEVRNLVEVDVEVGVEATVAGNDETTADAEPLPAKRARVEEATARADASATATADASADATATATGAAAPSPNLFNYHYRLAQTSTANTLTIGVDQLRAAFTAPENRTAPRNLYMCRIHGMTTAETGAKSCCVPFFSFVESFNVQTDNGTFCFITPRVFTPMNYNYFVAFVNTAISNANAQRKRMRVKEREALCFEEGRKHSKFAGNPFKFGTIGALRSGKMSLIRTNILGFKCHGARLTLTVDCALGPNYVAMPRHMYAQLDLATNYVIVKRDPSINSTCIYVCELLVHDDPADVTLHVNPFILDGLHGDQDGDELNIYFIRHEDLYNGANIRNSIVEILQLSWRYGYRHSVLYEPRYNFGQHYKYLMYRNDHLLQRTSALWRSLAHVPLAERPNVIMHLGASLLRNEVDDFVRSLIEFNTRHESPLLTYTELVTGEGAVNDVVESKSKGSKQHKYTYLERLRAPVTIAEYMRQLAKSFDDKIRSSNNMGREGQKQFYLLYALNSLTVFQDHIYVNDHVLMRNFSHCRGAFRIHFNVHAIDYFARTLLAD